MFGTRLRKITRDIWTRKVRTLLVSASIFIGVLGVVTLVTASNLLIAQLEEDIQLERLSMMNVVLTTQAGETLDDTAFLATIRAQDGVTHAEGRNVSPIFWRTDSAADFEQSTLIAHGEAYDTSYIQPTRLVEGRYPAYLNDPARLEVAVERRFADKYGLSIGDTIEVRLLSQAGNGEATPTAQAEIVGLVFQPYTVIASLNLGAADSLVFTTLEDAVYITGIEGFNLLNLRFETYDQAEEALPIIQGVIRQESAYLPLRANTEDPAENAQIDQTRSTGAILVSLAVIALVVSGFLIVNVVSSIVSEQRRQIGVMKSLGASNVDTFVIYAGIAVSYGLIAAIPGVILGIPAGYFAAQGLAGVFGTIIDEFQIVPIAVLLGAVLGVFVPLLAAFLPVYLGTRVSILDAITDLGIGGKFGRGRIERLIGHLPLPIALRQSVNNAFQKKGRLALTGLTLTLANGAFMGIFSVFFGLTQLADATFGTYGYQLAVAPDQAQPFSVLEDILVDKIDGVRAIEPAVSLSIDIVDFDAPPVVAGPPGITATGFNTASDEVLDLDLVEGTAWQDNPDREGVVISTRIRQYMDIGDGDEITLIAGGNRRTYTIIGVANWPFNDVWFRWQDLAEFGGLVDANGDPLTNAVNIILAADDPTADQVDDKANEVKEVLLDNGITANVDNIVASSELIVNIVTIFGVVLSMAALLIAAVGGVGLLTTLSISVFERQKEIGVMRSVGATSGNVAVQFVIEGIVVGVAAWLVAIPISLFIRQGLLANLPFGDVFEISYPPITLVIGLVGMLVLVTVASLWPAIVAARKTVSDILRYQ